MSIEVKIKVTLITIEEWDKYSWGRKSTQKELQGGEGTLKMI